MAAAAAAAVSASCNDGCRFMFVKIYDLCAVYKRHFGGGDAGVLMMMTWKNKFQIISALDRGYV